MPRVELSARYAGIPLKLAHWLRFVPADCFVSLSEPVSEECGPDTEAEEEVADVVNNGSEEPMSGKKFEDNIKDKLKPQKGPNISVLCFFFLSKMLGWLKHHNIVLLLLIVHGLCLCVVHGEKPEYMQNQKLIASEIMGVMGYKALLRGCSSAWNPNYDCITWSKGCGKMQSKVFEHCKEGIPGRTSPITKGSYLKDRNVTDWIKELEGCHFLQIWQSVKADQDCWYFQIYTAGADHVDPGMTRLRLADPLPVQITLNGTRVEYSADKGWPVITISKPVEFICDGQESNNSKGLEMRIIMSNGTMKKNRSSRIAVKIMTTDSLTCEGLHIDKKTGQLVQNETHIQVQVLDEPMGDMAWWIKLVIGILVSVVLVIIGRLFVWKRMKQHGFCGTKENKNNPEEPTVIKLM